MPRPRENEPTPTSSPASWHRYQNLPGRSHKAPAVPKRTIAIVAALSVALGSLSVATAAQQPTPLDSTNLEFSVDGSAWTNLPDTALRNWDGFLAPGQELTRTYWIRNTGPIPGRYKVGVGDYEITPNGDFYARSVIGGQIGSRKVLTGYQLPDFSAINASILQPGESARVIDAIGIPSTSLNPSQRAQVSPKIWVRFEPTSDDTDLDGVTDEDEKSLGTNPADSSDPGPLKVGEVGLPYPVTPVITAPNGSSFSITAGQLPPGLILGSDGTIMGTPTTVGTYPFVITVNTPDGRTVSVDRVITIAPSRDSDDDGLTDAEEIELGTNVLVSDTDNDGINDGSEVALGTDPLNPADPGAMPLGTVGSTYPSTPLITLPAGASISIELPTLPPGLSVDTDGTVTGVPSTSGSYSVKVTVILADGREVTFDRTVVILEQGAGWIEHAGFIIGVAAVNLYNTGMIAAGQLGIPGSTGSHAGFSLGMLPDLGLPQGRAETHHLDGSGPEESGYDPELASDTDQGPRRHVESTTQALVPAQWASENSTVLSPSDRSLASTGADIVAIALAAGALLTGGLCVMLIAHRRRSPNKLEGS